MRCLTVKRSSCCNQAMNPSPDTLWILSFLFTAFTVRRLQGLSWPFPDCFVFVCLSLGPERREWDSKRKRGEGKKSHSISWTDHWSGWLWHVMTQTASFLPLLSRCWPYKWCCRLPPYAIKHAVKQDGVLSPPHQHPDARCSFHSLTFSTKEKQITVFSLSHGFIHILFFFLTSSSSSLLVFYCLLWVLVWGEELKLP